MRALMLLLALCGIVTVGGSLPGCVQAEAPALRVLGIGGKADSPACTDRAYCWSEIEADIVVELGELGQRVLGEGIASKRWAFLQELVGLAHALQPRLTAAEMDKLEALANVVDGLDPLAIDVREYAAHLFDILRTPLQAYAHTQLAILAADLEMQDGNTLVERRRSRELDATLDNMRDHGTYGKVLAWAYDNLGLLDDPYIPVRADDLGAWDAAGETWVAIGDSRSQRIDDAVAYYGRIYVAGNVLIGVASYGAAVAMAGTPLAPIIASVVGSVASAAFGFWIQARMSLVIAAQNGMDVRRHDNLMRVTVFFASHLFFFDRFGRDDSTQTGIDMAKLAAMSLESQLLDSAVRTAALRYLGEAGVGVASGLFKFLLLYLGKEASKKALAKTAAKGVMQHAAGIVLFAVLGPIKNRAQIKDLGVHIDTLTRPWGRDMLVQDDSILADKATRTCLVDGLAALAWEDGNVSLLESRYVQALVSKTFWQPARKQFSRLGSAEQVRLATRMRTSPATTDVQACVASLTTLSERQAAMSYLAHHTTMMELGTTEPGAATAVPQIRGVYAALRAGMLQKPALGMRSFANFMEHHLHGLLHPCTLTADPACHEPVGAQLPYLQRPNKRAEANFACGFAGDCTCLATGDCAG